MNFGSKQALVQETEILMFLSTDEVLNTDL